MKLRFYRWKDSAEWVRPDGRPEWTVRVDLGGRFVEGYGETRLGALIMAMKGLTTFVRGA